MDRQEKQLNLFNFDKPYFVFNKKIRLIEFFAGIGAQARALEVLGVPFESYKICEWAVPSILAYDAIHKKEGVEYMDNSYFATREMMIERIRGVSLNYNEPMTDDQLNKKPDEWVRKVYDAVVRTNNLINVMNVKGEDLEIKETNKFDYLVTYSFPCQDLSLAGSRKGMSVSQSEGGTRSGLLWEIERILKECTEKPQVLLMENVPEVIGKGNVDDFVKWTRTLEQLGYTSYFEILNSKNYLIPQNRRRCFMVSILGDYAFDFPIKLRLKYKLKDLLEEKVDEKYYLSQRMIDFFTLNTTKQHEKGSGFTFKPVEKNQAELARTITCRSGQRMDDNFLIVKDNTKKGYRLAKEGDGVDISGRMEHHRGTVQDGLAQTLKTSMEVGVVVNDYYGVYDHKESDTFRPTLKSRVHKDSPTSKTLTCKEDSCCVIERERERE